jgi:hypothetical protein
MFALIPQATGHMSFEDGKAACATLYKILQVGNLCT